MPFSNLYTYPILRLFIPFAAGIFIGDYLFFESVHLPFWVWVSSALFLFFILLFLYHKSANYPLRWMFGSFSFVFFLIFGIGWSNLNLQRVTYPFPDEESVYQVVITDKPELKENSILCRAHVLKTVDVKPVALDHRRSVLLYFSPDSIGKTICRGDIMLCSAVISLPANRGNPDEFDYPRYLIHKGTAGTAYISSDKWKLIGKKNSLSVQDYAFDFRDKIIAFYQELGFVNDELAVLSALTVGHKENLSETIRESFSVSGASHVLALSGLHIGFVYFFLFFLLYKLPGNSSAMTVCRIVIIILFLWAFAIMTGSSASVIRSVIMYSLLGISQFLTRRPMSLHTLAVAAMGMLIYNPSWLFDVGFQLSFIAVASIILIQPWLYKRLSIHNRYLKKGWALVTVSIAAQIGTAPFVLFYFSRFPVHFLLTNILVIPLVTLIIYVAFIMLLWFAFPVVSQFIAFGLKFLVMLLNGTVRWIEELPFSSIDQVWLYRLEVILIYLIVFVGLRYMMKRHYSYLITCLSAIFIMTIYRVSMTEADRPEHSVVFYNVRGCPAVHCISPDRSSWLAYADSLPDEKRLLRVTSGYWNRLRLSTPVSIVDDYDDMGFVRYDNMLLFGNKRICIVNNNRWKNHKADSKFTVDYIYLCRGYDGKIEKLAELFNVEQIVLDPSFPENKQDAFLAECDRLGISCISLSKQKSYYKCLI